MYIKCKERKYHLQFTILSLTMSGKKNLHEGNILYFMQILHLSCQVQRLPRYQAPWSVLLRNRMAEQMNVLFCLLFKKCIIKQLLNSVFA